MDHACHLISANASALVKVPDSANVTERIQNQTSSYFPYCLLVLLHMRINQPVWRKTGMVLKLQPASWTCECHHWRRISCAAQRMFTAVWRQELWMGSWARRWKLLCSLAAFLLVSQDASSCVHSVIQPLFNSFSSASRMERVLCNRVSVLQSEKMFSLFWSAYE